MLSNLICFRTKWLNENIEYRRGNERQGKSSLTLSPSISAGGGQQAAGGGHQAAASVSATMTDLNPFPMKRDNSALIRETVKQLQHLQKIRRTNQKKQAEGTSNIFGIIGRTHTC